MFFVMSKTMESAPPPTLAGSEDRCQHVLTIRFFFLGGRGIESARHTARHDVWSKKQRDTITNLVGRTHSKDKQK